MIKKSEVIWVFPFEKDKFAFDIFRKFAVFKNPLIFLTIEWITAKLLLWNGEPKFDSCFVLDKSQRDIFSNTYITNLFRINDSFFLLVEGNFTDFSLRIDHKKENCSILRDDFVILILFELERKDNVVYH